MFNLVLNVSLHPDTLQYIENHCNMDIKRWKNPRLLCFSPWKVKNSALAAVECCVCFRCQSKSKLFAFLNVYTEDKAEIKWMMHTPFILVLSYASFSLCHIFIPRKMFDTHSVKVPFKNFVLVSNYKVFWGPFFLWLWKTIAFFKIFSTGSYCSCFQQNIVVKC